MGTLYIKSTLSKFDRWEANIHQMLPLWNKPFDLLYYVNHEDFVELRPKL